MYTQQILDLRSVHILTVKIFIILELLKHIIVLYIKKGKKMKIIRMTKGDWKNVKALFTISLEENSITIDSFKLVEKFDGSYFVGVPSRYNEKTEEWNNIVRLVPEKSQELLEIALKYYKEN